MSNDEPQLQDEQRDARGLGGESEEEQQPRQRGAREVRPHTCGRVAAKRHRGARSRRACPPDGDASETQDSLLSQDVLGCLVALLVEPATATDPSLRLQAVPLVGDGRLPCSRTAPPLPVW